MDSGSPAQESLRIALVQPHSFSSLSFGGSSPADSPGEEANLATIETYVARAVNESADLVIFPELFPGPAPESGGLVFEEVMDEVARQAQASGLVIGFGGAKVLESGYYNTYSLISPDGERFTYNKMIPATSEETAFHGDGPVVVDLGKAKVGLAICWEAWFPEIARTLTLRGAEILLFPTGGLIYELREVWTDILQARAAENTAYALASTSLFGAEDGMACIFGPEGSLGSSVREGMLCVNLDMNRLRTLRALDEEFVLPKRFRTIPGVVRSLPAHVVSAYSLAAADYLEKSA